MSYTKILLILSAVLFIAGEYLTSPSLHNIGLTFFVVSVIASSVDYILIHAAAKEMRENNA